MVEQTFYLKIYGGMFYMGTNDQIMQVGLGWGWGELMDKRFQRLSQVSLPPIDPKLGYWYIIWNVNTTDRGSNLKSTFSTLSLWGWGFHVKPDFFFKKFLVLTCSLMSRSSFTFMYSLARLMEKRVKALHSESEGSWLKPRLPVTLGSNEYQTQLLTLV